MLVVGRKRLSVIIPAPGGRREGGGERKRGRKREKNSIHKWERERTKENKTAAVGVHIRKREIGEIVYKIKRIMRNERERLTAVIGVSQLTASHSCSNTVQCTERSPASINTIIKDSLTVRSVHP